MSEQITSEQITPEQITPEQITLEQDISSAITLGVNILDNTTENSKHVKPARTKFEKTCDHCNKILKSEKTYEQHINNQVCYNKDETTYCKLCKIALPNRHDYVKHLLSMEHINKIGCHNLETLNNNQPSTILQIDPFLTNNEAKSIGTNNLGNKFTFVFQNNKTQTIDLVNNDNSNTNANRDLVRNNGSAVNAVSNESNECNVSNESNGGNGNTNQNSNNNVCGQIGNRKIEPTSKQQKILSILENANSVDEGCKLLLRMLDNKLNIEDYQGLQSIIRNDNNMKKELNNAYIDLIDKYVSMLVKRRNNGETIYKEKDISKIVILLTI